MRVSRLAIILLASIATSSEALAADPPSTRNGFPRHLAYYNQPAGLWLGSTYHKLVLKDFQDRMPDLYMRGLAVMDAPAESYLKESYLAFARAGVGYEDADVADLIYAYMAEKGLTAYLTEEASILQELGPSSHLNQESQRAAIARVAREHKTTAENMLDAADGRMIDALTREYSGFPAFAEAYIKANIDRYPADDMDGMVLSGYTLGQSADGVKQLVAKFTSARDAAIEQGRLSGAIRGPFDPPIASFASMSTTRSGNMAARIGDVTISFSCPAAGGHAYRIKTTLNFTGSTREDVERQLDKKYGAPRARVEVAYGRVAVYGATVAAVRLFDSGEDIDGLFVQTSGLQGDLDRVPAELYSEKYAREAQRCDEAAGIAH